jgi:hypothetical protein
MADAQKSGSNQLPSPLKTAKEQRQAEAPKLYVDGKTVSEEEYFKAAASQGYDVAVLRDMKYRPALSSK